MTVEPLSAAEESLWRTLVRLMTVLPRTLDDDLRRGTGLTLTHYVVLMGLSESPGRQLRMSDLAKQVELSPSRMTRVIQLLQSQGLVLRSPSSADARAGIASLTDHGLEVLREAWPTHLASARTVVFDHLEPQHLGLLAAALTQLLEAAQQPLAIRAGAGPVASSREGEPTGHRGGGRASDQGQ